MTGAMAPAAGDMRHEHYWKIAIGIGLGTSLEWYDFSVYGGLSGEPACGLALC